MSEGSTTGITEQEKIKTIVLIPHQESQNQSISVESH